MVIGNPSTAAPAVPPPTGEQRCDLRQRPAGQPVGYQRWNQLLFAHWQVDPAAVQATLPQGLFVDTFEGAAYLGIVPFAMERVRPAWLPPVPGISWFLELNLRTYVHDGQGNAGVWFYSLDCNQALAVWLARRFFHLPYFRARISASRQGDRIHYHCQRSDGANAGGTYIWTPGSVAKPVEPGSREFFLVERYLLFAADPAGRLYSGRVHHAPYRVAPAVAPEISVEPALQAGFALAGTPVSVLTAEPVDVSVYRLTRAPRGSNSCAPTTTSKRAAATA